MLELTIAPTTRLHSQTELSVPHETHFLINAKGPKVRGQNPSNPDPPACARYRTRTCGLWLRGQRSIQRPSKASSNPRSFTRDERAAQTRATLASGRCLAPPRAWHRVIPGLMSCRRLRPFLDFRVRGLGALEMAGQRAVMRAAFRVAATTREARSQEL